MVVRCRRWLPSVLVTCWQSAVGWAPSTLPSHKTNKCTEHPVTTLEHCSEDTDRPWAALHLIVTYCSALWPHLVQTQSVFIHYLVLVQSLLSRSLWHIYCVFLFPCLYFFSGNSFSVWTKDPSVLEGTCLLPPFIPQFNLGLKCKLTVYLF